MKFNFKNTKDTPPLIDMESVNGNEYQGVKKIYSKTYNGPSRVGMKPPTPVTKFNTKIGGVTVKPKDFIQHGKRDVTPSSMSGALDEVRNKLRKACNLEDKTSREYENYV